MDRPTTVAERPAGGLKSPVAGPAVRPRRRFLDRPGLAPAVAVASALAWVALIVGTHFWGVHVVHADPRSRIFAAPLAGRSDPRWAGAWPLPAVLVGACAVVAPFALRRRPWQTALWLSFAGAAVWAAALALSDGPANLWGPLTTRWDYLVNLDAVTSHGPIAFLSGFVAHAGTYATHVRAHPPGMLLVLWGLSRVGLGGSKWAAAVVILVGASAVPAVLVAARNVAGERRARAALPFLVFAPMALWLATSADALFAGVAAWGTMLTILATDRARSNRDALAVAGGLLLGVAAFLSYGVVLIALVPVSIALARRSVRPLIVAAGVAALVGLAFAAAGFSWLAGLSSARAQYLAGASAYRPQSYFLLGNLGAFAIVLGPAVAVAFGRLRDRRVWILVAAALAAVAVADVTALSKGEVERIWLPFAPWIVAATAAFVPRADRREPAADVRANGLAEDATPRMVPFLLAAQVATALAVQLVVRSPW
jgi:hypothetical protein